MSFLFFNKAAKETTQTNFVELDEQELQDVNGGHRDSYCYDDDDHCHDDDDDDCYEHRHHS